jgi:hypothetical protein
VTLPALLPGTITRVELEALVAACPVDREDAVATTSDVAGPVIPRVSFDAPGWDGQDPAAEPSPGPETERLTGLFDVLYPYADQRFSGGQWPGDDEEPG